MKKSSLENQKRIRLLIRFLSEESSSMEKPGVGKLIDSYGRDPYLILIGCILSLRTKDSVSYPASLCLFAKAKTPQTMLKLSSRAIEKLIYSVGFYRIKAANILSISADILNRFEGQVPRTKQELLSLRGVGLKTANLVLGEAFHIPAICVDTHVHRIANVIGLVHTKTPEQTEHELKKIIPKRYWTHINSLLVKWGQNKGPLAPLRAILNRPFLK